MTLVHETPIHTRKFVRLQSPNRLDTNGGAVLRQQLDATELERNSIWFIDMAQVEFIDNAGILALVSALRLARSVNCQLLIGNLRPSIRLVFEITQLDQAFEIIDDTTAFTAMAA